MVYFGVVKIVVFFFLFFLFIFTECWPLRCCLALLYHQIARHQFCGGSLGRFDFLFVVIFR